MFRLIFIVILFIAQASYGNADPFYSVFTEDGKQGLKNEQGQIIIPPHFDALGWSFSSNEVKNNRIGFLKNNLWGIVGIDNKVLYPAELEAVYDATPYLIIAGEKQANGKFKKGAIEYDGKKIIPYKYDMLKAFENRLLAFKDNSYGLLDLKGKIIIPFSYQQIKQVSSSHWFAINETGRGALFNNNGVQLTKSCLDNVDPYNNSVFTATVNHFKGLLDKDGLWLLEPAFKDIEVKHKKASGIPYIEFFYYSTESDVKWHLDSVKAYKNKIFQHYASGSTWLSDAEGNLIFPPSESIEKHKNLLIVTKNAATGLFHLEKNRWMVEPSFNSIELVGDQHFLAQKSGGRPDLWGLYKVETGEKVISGINTFKRSEEGIYLQKNGAWGFMENTGKVILPLVFDEIKQIKYDLFVVTFHGSDGIIDKDEEWHIMPRQGAITDFNPYIYISYYDGLYNMHNYAGERLYFSPGKLVISNNHVDEYEDDSVVRRLDFSGMSYTAAHIDNEYKIVLPISEGFIGIEKNGQYGFVDPQGRLRIANRYDNIQPFKNGFASVKLNGKWGVIDKQERLVIQPLYDSVGYFNEGHAVVASANKLGVINTSGELVLDITYDKLISFANNHFMLFQEQKIGVADPHGKVLIWPQYNTIEYSEGYFIVKKDHLYGLHNSAGIAVLPPFFKMIIPLPGQKDFIIGRQKEIVVTTFD